MSEDQQQEQSGPPKRFGNTTPSTFDHDRHDYIVNITQVHERLGRLTTSVEFLDRDIKNMRDRDLGDVKSQIEENGRKIATLEKRIYAAMVILSILGPVALFLLEKLWPVIAPAVGHTG